MKLDCSETKIRSVSQRPRSGGIPLSGSRRTLKSGINRGAESCPEKANRDPRPAHLIPTTDEQSSASALTALPKYFQKCRGGDGAGNRDGTNQNRSHRIGVVAK